MKVSIDGLDVLFPYDYIYPEQYQYMKELKRALDGNGHALLEMPSGTGKTATLLSLLLAYHEQHADRYRQVIYCTRTVPEIDKTLVELKRILDYRRQHTANDAFVGVGLSSRKNLCINEHVVNKHPVDAHCQELTASWMRAKNGSKCPFYEKLFSDNVQLPSGVYTLDDLKEYGLANGQCPYFTARLALQTANVIVYSYYYLLDPKVADLISKHLPRDAVVVFDEAHNIDNVCIESLSVKLSKSSVESASKTLGRLAERIQDIKTSNVERLNAEYERLIEGLKKEQRERLADRIMASPVLAEDLALNSENPEECMIPGSIRRAEHFIAFLKRLVEFLRARFRSCLHVISETPMAFLQSLRESTLIEQRPLRFCSERLASLTKTLELNSVEDFGSLNRIAAFATLVSTYVDGFSVLFEPFDELSGENQAMLTLACLDATIAIKPVLSRFRSVVITSGTLSPLDIYPKLLNFSPIIISSLPMTLCRDTISPLIVTRGSDQVAISSRFEIRNDPAVVRNYGQLLMDMAKTVPDGVVAFFPSYIYLESIVAMWQEMGITEELLKWRLLFIETPDGQETAMALHNYRHACDCGHGAVLLSVARGKVSEGIDFDHHYGRAVILFGIPYQYTESRILKARLEYMRDECGIKETDFLTFDALRHAAQCLGRVLHGKSDYGLMILADKRYARKDKRSKLPKWIGQSIKEGNTNLSSDQAIILAKRFFREMGQPVDQRSQLGYTLLTEADISQLNEEDGGRRTDECDDMKTDEFINLELKPESKFAHFASTCLEFTLFVQDHSRDDPFPIKRGMKAKKAYEVSKMAPLLKSLGEKLNVSNFVDIGAGQGLLDLELLSTFDAQVFAVEREETVLAKCKHESIHSIHLNIDCQTSGEALVQSIPDEPFILHSLHACGSLTDHMIRLFVEIGRPARAMVNVGCCYNLINSFPNSHAFSACQATLNEHHKMAACQCPLRWQYDREAAKKSIISNYHRALFQVFLQQSPHWDGQKIGKIKCNDNQFTTFASDALRKLNLISSADHLAQIESEFGKYKNAFVYYLAVKAYLGMVIESLIIYDRYLYLKESCSDDVDVQIVPIFSLRHSPRRFAIIAERRVSK